MTPLISSGNGWFEALLVLITLSSSPRVPAVYMCDTPCMTSPLSCVFGATSLKPVRLPSHIVEGAPSVTVMVCAAAGALISAKDRNKYVNVVRVDTAGTLRRLAHARVV